RKQLQAPLRELKNHSEAFKNMALNYVYLDQVPEVVNGGPMYHGVKISATNADPEEVRIPAVDGSIQPGTFQLLIPDMAYYRVERNGNILPALANSNHPFVAMYGSLLSQAMGEQKGFGPATLPPIMDYIRVADRKRKAAEQLPQLENLIKEVDRLE